MLCSLETLTDTHLFRGPQFYCEKNILWDIGMELIHTYKTDVSVTLSLRMICHMYESECMSYSKK